MTEFHTLRPIDNSRLVRCASPERLREMARLVILGSLVAALALLYAWQHFACIQSRYQLLSLKSDRAQASELNRELKVEAAALASPARIDQIARGQLGMTAPSPGQLVPWQGPGEPAMAPVMAEMRGGGPEHAP